MAQVKIEVECPPGQNEGQGQCLPGGSRRQRQGPPEDSLSGESVCVWMRAGNWFHFATGGKYAHLKALHDKRRTVDVNMNWKDCIQKEFNLQLDPELYHIKRAHGNLRYPSVKHSLESQISELVADYKTKPGPDSVFRVTIMDSQSPRRKITGNSSIRKQSRCFTKKLRRYRKRKRLDSIGWTVPARLNNGSGFYHPRSKIVLRPACPARRFADMVEEEVVDMEEDGEKEVVDMEEDGEKEVVDMEEDGEKEVVEIDLDAEDDQENDDPLFFIVDEEDEEVGNKPTVEILSPSESVSTVEITLQSVHVLPLRRHTVVEKTTSCDFWPTWTSVWEYIEESPEEFEFIVGTGTSVVRHVVRKVFLEMRSKEFRNFVRAVPNNCITWPDMESKVFDSFLHYLCANKFLSNLDFSIENFTHLLDLLVKYIPDESDVIIYEMITIKNMYKMAVATKNLKLEHLQNYCSSYIESVNLNLETTLASEEFLAMDIETICEMVKRDDLNIDELTLFKSLVRWAENREGESLRQKMGEVIRLIRLPLIPAKQIKDVVLPLGILSDKELMELILFITVDGCNNPEYKAFPSNPRVYGVNQ